MTDTVGLWDAHRDSRRRGGKKNRRVATRVFDAVSLSSNIVPGAVNQSLVGATRMENAESPDRLSKVLVWNWRRTLGPERSRSTWVAVGAYEAYSADEDKMVPGDGPFRSDNVVMWAAPRIGDALVLVDTRNGVVVVRDSGEAEVLGVPRESLYQRLPSQVCAEYAGDMLLICATWPIFDDGDHSDRTFITTSAAPGRWMRLDGLLPATGRHVPCAALAKGALWFPAMVEKQLRVVDMRSLSADLLDLPRRPAGVYPRQPHFESVDLSDADATPLLISVDEDVAMYVGAKHLVSIPFDRCEQGGGSFVFRSPTQTKLTAARGLDLLYPTIAVVNSIDGTASLHNLAHGWSMTIGTAAVRRSKRSQAVMHDAKGGRVGPCVAVARAQSVEQEASFGKELVVVLLGSGEILFVGSRKQALADQGSQAFLDSLEKTDVPGEELRSRDEMYRLLEAESKEEGSGAAVEEE